MMGRRRGGLVRTVGRTAVIAGTASAVAGGVNRRQTAKANDKQQAAQDQQQAAYDQGAADATAPPPAAPTDAGAGSDDMFAKLERLGQLHEQGILTDEEFAAQKSKILAG